MLELAFSLAGSLALLYLFLTRSERDGTTLISIWLALLWLMSARWVLAPLGAVGSPAIVFGVGLAILWLLLRLSGRGEFLAQGPQPVRLGVTLYGLVVLSSYAVAQLRPLSELEASSSDRALILLASLAGVALLTADGVTTRARLDTLLKRLVAVASVMGLIGAAQFFAGLDIAQQLRLPGLTQNAPMMGLRDRSLFEQAYGTTLHPIEFGVVMALVLPLALHYATFSSTRRGKVTWTAASAVLAIGALISVARSGTVAVAVAMAVFALGWSWRWRLNGAVYALGFLAVMWAVVPGLVGTIRSLFEGWGNDPNIQARLDRVPRIVDQLEANGPLGLGPGTFTPEEYFLLDNEYYMTLMNLGWPGVFAVLAMLGLGIGTALIAKRGADAETRDLAQALVAGLAVVPVVMATFDAFSFPTFTGTVYLLLGASGALWRLTVPTRSGPSIGGTSVSSAPPDTRQEDVDES